MQKTPCRIACGKWILQQGILSFAYVLEVSKGVTALSHKATVPVHVRLLWNFTVRGYIKNMITMGLALKYIVTFNMQIVKVFVLSTLL